METIIVYTDGGARGNPGPAAVGVVYKSGKGETIKKISETIGEATNNVAEYKAVILALKKAKQIFGKEKAKKIKFNFKLDSELVVKQLNHQYKIQEDGLQPLFFVIWNLLLDFGEISFSHIPREQNKEADALVNQALDQKEETLF